MDFNHFGSVFWEEIKKYQNSYLDKLKQTKLTIELKKTSRAPSVSVRVEFTE